ncbi:MAG TPA: hypothetical protein VMT14_03345 [Burkholderiaceae bacterium]|jgi:hypothetical protein|nr:hypothetical protein [Burkholderiaceae bacterium]
MSQPQIQLVFSSDDQAWIRREQIAVPKFWQDHAVAPLVGDVLRFGGRQFVIEARVWEHEAGQPLLRLFVSNARAESDTSLGSLA